jgi:hypothetical protein
MLFIELPTFAIKKTPLNMIAINDIMAVALLGSQFWANMPKKISYYLKNYSR